MDESASLMAGRKYAIKHTTRWARAMVRELTYRIDVNTLHRDETATELGLNEIGRVLLRVTQPLFVDPYQVNRADGLLHPRRRGDEQDRRGGHDRPDARGLRPGPVGPRCGPRWGSPGQAAAACHPPSGSTSASRNHRPARRRETRRMGVVAQRSRR